MSGESDDPIKRRAEQLRAENDAAEKSQRSHDADLRQERMRFVQMYLGALTDKTSHAVECVEADPRAHGAVARFSFLRDGKSWTQNMFEFGIDRMLDENGRRELRYYLLPTSAAFSIANPRTGVAREVRESTADEVIEFAIVISVEMMARVVASGGMLGTASEIDAAIADQMRATAQRERVAKRERGQKFWRGCGISVLWFFGIFIGIGLLGNLLRACSGQP
ncbi:MAG: hypothetical protein JNM59_02965 [Hyphomonadaceae bacterium]|nr:hypothetical protein [Hyphomonadaceae bacterium]